MSTYFKTSGKHRFRALIKKCGTIEVEQVKCDAILGCSYFKSGTAAYKVAEAILYAGLDTPKREGWMVQNGRYVHTDKVKGFYLGSIVLQEKTVKGDEFATESARSTAIHDACEARL